MKRTTSRMLAFLMSLIMVSALIMPIGAGAADASDGTAYNTSETAAVEEPEAIDAASESREESADAAVDEEESGDASADEQEESADAAVDEEESADAAVDEEESADVSADEREESAGTSGEGAEKAEDEDASKGKASQDDKSEGGRSSGSSAAVNVEAEADDDTIVFRTDEVTVITKKSAFKTEVTMTVEPVTDPVQLLKMVSALKEEGGSYTVKAYTVSFYDKNGKEVEPLVPVQVTVNTDVKTPAKSKVVHVKDDDKTEILEADIDKSGASFELDSFSDIGVATEVKTMVPGSSFELYLDSERTTEYEVGDLPAGPILAEELPEIDGYEYENATVEEALVEEIGTITDAEGNVYVYYTTKDESGKISAAILDDGRIRINLVRTEVDTSYDLDAEGVHVHVEAPAGAFDEGTYMEIQPIQLSDAQREQVQEQAAGKFAENAELRFRAIDITFYNENGQKVQPRETVNVMVTTNDGVKKDFCVVHLGDDDSADLVEAKRSDNGDISFAAKSFSVYVVVEDGAVAEESRMTINFYNGEELIATMYVKNDDDTADEIEQILHDPGIGTVPSNSLFKGWSLDKADYSVEDSESAMDIEEIRTWAREKANADSIEEGEVHNFYAMVYQTYSVVFLDEDGATIHGEALIFKPGEEVKYSVNTPYTPKDQDSQFQGWYATTVSGEAVTTEDGTPIGSAATGPIPNPTTVIIPSSTTFTPRAPRGHWLVFNSNTEPNTSRATYTPPQFVMEGTTTVEPTAPTRLGYTFGGWYTDAACTAGKEFEFDEELGEGKELYAKWTPVPTANYTVILWQQNVDATGYDFVESITLPGNTGTVINTVTQQGTGDNAYARVNGVNKIYDGFHLKEFDQNVTITPEGDAVLNVYYDRTEYTLRFFYARSYDYETPGTMVYNRIGTCNNRGVPSGFNYDSDLTYYGYYNNQYIPLYYRNGSFYRNAYYWNTYSGNVYLREEIPGGTHTYIQVNANNEGFLRHNGGTLEGSLSYYLTNDYQRLTNGNTWKDVNNSSVNGNPLNLVSSAYLAKPEVSSGSIQINGVTTDVVTNSTTSSRQTVNTTYYYLDVKVRYGQTLENLWPNPATTFIGQDLTSYNRPHNSGTVETNVVPLLTGSWATRNNIGGIYQQMTSDLFVGDDTIAYFDVYWRLNEYYSYRYNVYFSTLEGESPTTTYKNKGYVYQNDLSYVVSNGQGWANSGAPTDSGAGYWDVANVTFDGTNLVGRVDVQRDGTINVYYDRKIHNIVYRDGIYVNGDNGIIKNQKDNEPFEEKAVLYGQDISSYAEGEEHYYEPPAQEGFVFEGWYMDSEGQHPYTFSGTMPDKDITVYAKWRQVQYRVLLHPNVPSDATSLNWGGQEMSFRVNEGEKIAGGNKIIGTADQYEFIGWYTDPGCTNSFEMSAVTLNDETVTTPYDTMDDGVYNPTDPTELDDRGIPKSDINKDAQEGRYWITKKLELYGKWRAILEGAKGIRVVYTANSDDVYGHFSGGETTYTDPMAYYLDRSEANATGASIPNDTDQYQFMYWVVQRWDEAQDKYVDTDQIVYPGDTFEVLKANARVEDIPGATDPDNNKTYTVQIRAEYDIKDMPTPTHIWWFPNNTAVGTRHSASAADNDLQINEAVPIEPAPTRPGYKFLGWARVSEEDSESAEGAQPTDMPTGKSLELTEDDLFLKYENGEYKGQVDGEWVKVTQVAADEQLPYHDMYAVWEKLGVNIEVSKNVTGNMGDVTRSFTFTAVMTDGSTFPDQDAGSGISLSSDKKTATFSLMHGESVTIAGVPSMAAMKITESNADGYVTTAEGISGGSLSGRTYSFTVPEEDGAVTFTNNKTVEVDTGIRLDFLPYVLLLGMTAAGAIWILRRRREV